MVVPLAVAMPVAASAVTVAVSAASMAVSVTTTAVCKERSPALINRREINELARTFEQE